MVKGAEANIILVVEDEPSIRESLRDLLEIEGYQVLTAPNGESGLTILRQHKPDLIISDVMMPKMSGFEFLKAIRSNAETELIPVIMLTAMVELESKLEGLGLGADDYITKPFVFKEVNLRINNLLERRKKLFNAGYVSTKAPEAVSQEVIFLKKLNLLVEEQLEEPKLSISMLAAQLHMSLSTFNRKAKKVTGKAPVQYIKEYKLQKARKMIRLNYGNITEIARKCGFSSSSYFSTSYKEFYGCSPKSDIPD